MATLQSLQTRTPSDRTLTLSLAQARILAGQTAALLHDDTTAQLYWVRARDSLAPLVRAGNDPRQLAAYAEALLRLGDAQHASAIVSRLSAMGYSTPDFVKLVTSAKLPYPINAALAKRIADSREDTDTQP